MRILGTILALIFVIVATVSPVAATHSGHYLSQLVENKFGVTRNYNMILDAVAYSEANRIAIQGYMSHRHIDELTSAGWSYGDVLAWSRYYTTPEDAMQAAVNGWFTSSNHNWILLEPLYTQIGCGHVREGDEDWSACIVGKPPASTASVQPLPSSGKKGIIEQLPDTAIGENITFWSGLVFGWAFVLISVFIIAILNRDR